MTALDDCFRKVIIRAYRDPDSLSCGNLVVGAVTVVRERKKYYVFDAELLFNETMMPLEPSFRRLIEWAKFSYPELAREAVEARLLEWRKSHNLAFGTDDLYQGFVKESSALNPIAPLHLQLFAALTILAGRTEDWGDKAGFEEKLACILAGRLQGYLLTLLRNHSDLTGTKLLW